MSHRPLQQSLFGDREMESSLSFERNLARRGYSLVAGIDEAGRGPLAGPVVAAAVVLHPDRIPEGIDDSKKLSPSRRERLHDDIIRSARGVGIGIVPPETIDRVNILQATFAAMRQAVEQLPFSPDWLLVDGSLTIPGFANQEAIVRGDSRSLSIAAASIVAKVTRDRIMDDLDLLWPGYGFKEHKGYGTKSHREAIARLGVTPVHRRSFAGVREYCDPKGSLTLPLF